LFPTPAAAAAAAAAEGVIEAASASRIAALMDEMIADLMSYDFEESQRVGLDPVFLKRPFSDESDDENGWEIYSGIIKEPMWIEVSSSKKSTAEWTL
jgi:hypothetical protein